ncbi:16S rRNA (cytidine(1402)-2'-O)-methyltransferase, partial [Candidatus Venteria ishoeyi]|uniref:16S rRNA (cytidine(1402)-2'-O)-methyltransferase n=1 Tax=Candidatus Venteria ishoeyi TaxID=1899563 RepID=UPI000B11F841
MNESTACLYIVATPIGNLEDISQRALRILQHVALVAAEDTRHSRPLLLHFGINTPLRALHEHNEQQATQQLLQQLHQGDSIALISDAGTPLISDPGQRFVQAVHQAGIPVCPIPGASALICALSAAGFSADQFCFEGFLPAKAGTREQRLQVLQDETRTLVFYEAPHRIKACVKAMLLNFGAERPAALLKELTKLHETVYRGTLAEILRWLEAEAVHCKGEFILV